ncbi:unnamed protein product, partial [Brassica napus]
MEPFFYMVPYLLVECASSDEQRAQYSLEPFTYERPTNIPPARADFAKANGKSMRDKMAVDIFQELLTRMSSKTRTWMTSWVRMT